MTLKTADLLVEAGQVVTCAPGNQPRRGPDLGPVGLLAPGALAVKDGRIAQVGSPAQVRSHWEAADPARAWKLPHQVVIPGLVDCHTHPVFAGSRVEEYLMRARGATYPQIMARGGGILSTVDATRRASTDELTRATFQVFSRMLRHGTTTLEAKSGYGLEWDEERRELLIIKEAGARLPLEVVPTYLGAHALPREAQADREGFLARILEALPRVKAQGLAEAVDVFCEEGAFSLDESRRILEAARRLGFALRIHAEEFSNLGAARLGAELGAASADHLTRLDPDDMTVLAGSHTLGVVLPATTLFLGKGATYAPARAMLEAGMALAVASDYNAGSCRTESLAFACSLAVLQMGLTPEEALLCVTVNGAHALGRGEGLGSLEVGKQADFLVLDLEDYREWPYHAGVNLVERVVKAGRLAVTGGEIEAPADRPRI